MIEQEIKDKPKEKCDKKPKLKRPWGHILDDNRYTSGPGENIYVYG